MKFPNKSISYRYLHTENNVIYEISFKKHEDDCSKFYTVTAEDKNNITLDDDKVNLLIPEVINVSVFDSSNNFKKVEHFYLDNFISVGDTIVKKGTNYFAVPNKNHFKIENVTTTDISTYTTYLNDYYVNKIVNNMLNNVDLKSIYNSLPIYLKNKDFNGNTYKVSGTYPKNISSGLYLDASDNVKLTSKLEEKFNSFLISKYTELINNDLNIIDNSLNTISWTYKKLN